MLSEQEILDLCQRLQLSSQAQALLMTTQSATHSQRGGEIGGFASMYYPSRKMAHSIRAESGALELAFLREMEHDDNGDEVYDQHRFPEVSSHSWQQEGS